MHEVVITGKSQIQPQPLYLCFDKWITKEFTYIKFNIGTF